MSGISFARKIGNNIEIVTIPTTSYQKFRYFYNPSKLTAEQRKEIYNQRNIKNILLDLTEPSDEE